MTAPEPVDGERLRIEAAKRDPTRFAELYEAHFERVYAYAVRRVRDRHEAEDVTAELPADQRRVIEMRFTEEKTIREIAGELGRSEGAVKQLQFRAVQSLRARMGQANG